MKLRNNIEGHQKKENSLTKSKETFIKGIGESLTIEKKAMRTSRDLQEREMD